MKGDRLLEEGMGSDDHIRTAIRDSLQSFLSGPSLDGTRQQHRADRKAALFHIIRKSVHMLPCQYFRGSHESALPAVFRTQDQCQESQNRLAGTDVSLQEPVHQPGAREVCADLLPGRHLLLCEGKRQTLQKPVRPSGFSGDLCAAAPHISIACGFEEADGSAVLLPAVFPHGPWI